MLPFLGRRLFDWQVRALRAAGVRDIGVVRGYRGEVFDGEDVRLWTNDRWAATNMVYTLFCASDALCGQGALVVAYGDIVYSPDAVRAVQETPGDAVVAVDRNWRALWEARYEDPLADAESLRLDGDGRIVDIGRKVDRIEDIEAQYIGLMRFSPAALAHLGSLYAEAATGPAWLMGRTRERCHMTDLLRGLIAAGAPPQAAIIDGGWLEFDTAGDLALYDRMAGEGTLDRFFPTAEALAT